MKVLFTIAKPAQPVAFAANVLYAFEFNSRRDKHNLEKFCYPLLKEKAQYMSLDNISGSLYGLSLQQDPEIGLVKTILHAAKNKNLDLTLVEAYPFSIDNASDKKLVTYEQELFMKP